MKHILFTFLFGIFSFGLTAQDFQPTPEEDHFFLLLPSPITDMNELGAAIAKHNHAYYPTDDLEVTTVSMKLEEKKIFYYIPNFKNKTAALHYYNSLAKHKSAIIIDDNASYHFIISKSNLNEVLKSKSLEPYKTFFQENYL